MRTLALTMFIVLLASLPCLAYPPAHSPSDAPIYKDPPKRSTNAYEQSQTLALPTYAREQKNDKKLTPYQDRSSTLSDFYERNPRDPEFELYNKIQDKYEKTPRFSY